MSAGSKRTTRCAIYTRKSSEEGLEQSFNSLDAQREACEAYILSQRQEDGAFSKRGMTMAVTPAAPWNDLR
jgi:DNA invertase Pin-like site-specific DNA recombinase